MKVLILIGIYCSCISICAQQSLRIVFYNVENLFDIENDSAKQDDEFLPGGLKGWTKSRYWDKLNHIYKTLIAVGGWEAPAIVGMCELENRSVIYDLVRKTPLKFFSYEIIHEDSPDQRGIDVGLIYRPDKFRPVYHEAIPVRFPFAPDARTRDILYVKGILAGLDTVHLFVNHWPSRAGGQEVSEPRRIFAAELIRAKVDSILKNPNSHILIMGDFNDEPEDLSLTKGLKASIDSADVPHHLLNGMHPYVGKFTGTEKHAGHWNLLDQFIFSVNFFQSGTLSVTGNRAFIFEGEWLLEPDPQFLGNRPFRTYAGPRYLGGYSDHLPVYIDVTGKQN